MMERIGAAGIRSHTSRDKSAAPLGCASGSWPVQSDLTIAPRIPPDRLQCASVLLSLQLVFSFLCSGLIGGLCPSDASKIQHLVASAKVVCHILNRHTIADRSRGINALLRAFLNKHAHYI